MARKARALMVQGTGSNVGKSLLVAGLCRAARNRGFRVLPFKPQNMSSQAVRMVDGALIGSAQALQARACGVIPQPEMNPVLLMPRSDTGAQVLVRGRLWCETEAVSYGALKRQLAGVVQENFASLRSEADLVLVEGAGSPAEVNLRQNDIANMGFARASDVPVVLLGDIDRGGIIAQLVGTQAVLDPKDAAMIEGFIINRFRGNPRLFDDGYRLIEARTGWPGFGVVPWFADAALLPAEDTQSLASAAQHLRPQPGATRIACLALSRLTGLDTLDPLRLEPSVELLLVEAGTPLPADVAAVILPDSCAPESDLAFLNAQGWAVDLAAHHRRGGRIFALGEGAGLARRALAPLLATLDAIELLPADTDFSNDEFRAAWLQTLGVAPDARPYNQRIERVLDTLAAHLEAHLDVDALLALAR